MGECKKCEHNCHCSNGQCECKDCDCKKEEKTIEFDPEFELTVH